jgi:hypothetical protein
MTRFALVAVAALAFAEAAAAQLVFTGLDYNFTKPNGADIDDPQFQDRLTQSVWLVRGDSQGLFNKKTETEWNATSPQDTEWATYINNPGDTISATNWASLDFDNWVDAYGGTGGGNLPTRLTGGNAVLHLIPEDIYLDVRFTSWAAGRDLEGAGFSYLRSIITVPEPHSIGLAALAVSLLGLSRRRPRGWSNAPVSLPANWGVAPATHGH